MKRKPSTMSEAPVIRFERPPTPSPELEEGIDVIDDNNRRSSSTTEANRSLPYYEVPSNQRRDAPRLPTTPPPFKRFANRDASTISRVTKHSYIHTIGLPSTTNGKLV